MICGLSFLLDCVCHFQSFIQTDELKFQNQFDLRNYSIRQYSVIYIIKKKETKPSSKIKIKKNIAFQGKRKKNQDALKARQKIINQYKVLQNSYVHYKFNQNCKNYNYDNLKSNIDNIELFVMEKKEMTLIYYHVPEDRDDPDVPNMFAIPISKNNLKLAHIYQYFPLKGTYNFRFKFAHESFIVWLDVTGSDSKLPLFKDRIYIKATRLSWAQSKANDGLSQSTKLNTQNKKQEINLFEHHEQKIAKNLNEKKQPHIGENLLGSMGQTSFFTQQNQTHTLDFFQANSKGHGVSKKGDFNLMGGVEKHRDLI